MHFEICIVRVRFVKLNLSYQETNNKKIYTGKTCLLELCKNVLLLLLKVFFSDFVFIFAFLSPFKMMDIE